MSTLNVLAAPPLLLLELTVEETLATAPSARCHRVQRLLLTSGLHALSRPPG